MENYRFVQNEAGDFLAFDKAFQREAFDRYLEQNGLCEDNVCDALCNKEIWEDIGECPSALPDKYTGDIYEELEKIRQDLAWLGLADYDCEYCFEDMTRYPFIDVEDKDEAPCRVVDILKSLGYVVEERNSDSMKIYCIK